MINITFSLLATAFVVIRVYATLVVAIYLIGVVPQQMTWWT
jgi:hypothetical protein